MIVPRIRDYESSERATGPLPNGQASPNAFGANIGQSLQDLGNAASSVAVAINRDEARRKAHKQRGSDIDEALAASKLHMDMTVAYHEATNKAAAGAPDFANNVGTKFDELAAKHFPNGAASKTAQLRIMTLKTHFFNEAVGHEAKEGSKLIVSNLKEALKVNENTVTLDPRTYEDKVGEGVALIDKMAASKKDAKGLNAADVNSVKRDYVEKLTKDYFRARYDPRSRRSTWRR